MSQVAKLSAVLDEDGRHVFLQALLGDDDDNDFPFVDKKPSMPSQVAKNSAVHRCTVAELSAALEEDGRHFFLHALLDHDDDDGLPFVEKP